MVRLRNSKGEVIPLSPDTLFVELTDSDGKIALVFYVKGNQTVTFDEDSVEAVRYKTLYKDAKFVPVKEYND